MDVRSFPAPAVTREAEEDWGRRKTPVEQCSRHQNESGQRPQYPGRELSRGSAFWSRLHQKVFEFEQFTQVVNCLISILLVADSLKPMMYLAPRRRPTDLHCFINEGARVGKRGEAPWLWLVFDQEWRFDTKIVHENPHRSVAPRTLKLRAL
jgi:hypothetical protein